MFHKLEHFLDCQTYRPSCHMLIQQQGSYSERKDALSLSYAGQLRGLKASDHEAARGAGHWSTAHSSGSRNSLKERACVHAT
jgi:hypothetical protein